MYPAKQEKTENERRVHVIGKGNKNCDFMKRVSMGLTVNRQMAQKLTVNRQKRNIFTVNRQMSEPKLAVEFLRHP